MMQIKIYRTLREMSHLRHRLSSLTASWHHSFKNVVMYLVYILLINKPATQFLTENNYSKQTRNIWGYKLK